MKKRTQIYLTEKEHKYLKEKSEKDGISISELIRKILDNHIKCETIHEK